VARKINREGVAAVKQAITDANTALAQDPLCRFIGYGLKHGRAYGTLANIPEDQIIDTPVAENLLMGVAIGYALKGYKPVAFFERMDFLTNAMDAIVNHLDKMHRLSHGEFSPAVIIRTVVGNTKKPLFTGPVHTQDFTAAMRLMVDFPVVTITNEWLVQSLYAQAQRDQAKGVSTMIVEYKDLL
jgi:pyruvate/2-oxoglutarate/acetoin dehydrogenase E1 component